MSLGMFNCNQARCVEELLPEHDINGIVDEMIIEREQHMEEESSIVNPSSLIVDKKGKGKIKDEHTSTLTMQCNIQWEWNELIIDQSQPLFNSL